MTASRLPGVVVLIAGVMIALAAVSPSSAVDKKIFIKYKQEHVTNGRLDLTWANGFGVSNNMAPLTLAPEHPAYANPSGDHTVADATNSMPDSGGVILTAIDPELITDYLWEADFFTGEGNTRRGLVVRANPTNNFASCYQFVVQTGLFQINFRRLVNGMPTTLGTWFATDLPGGLPQNTWHHMKVLAVGPTFRLWIDDHEFTSEAAPIVDDSLATGWVGVYNFRFDLGGVPFLTDDLILWQHDKTPARDVSFGQLKELWRSERSSRATLR